MQSAKSLYNHLAQLDSLFMDDIPPTMVDGRKLVDVMDEIGLGMYRSPNEVGARRVLFAFMLGWQYRNA